MATMNDLTDLTERVDEEDISWRVRNSGLRSTDSAPFAIVVPFLDSRYVMRRLDAAVGPANWQFEVAVQDEGAVKMPDRYYDSDAGEWRTSEVPELVRIGSARGRLGIRLDGEWIWKADAADFTDVSSVKGGVTQALRRAAVPWNIAGIRDIYRVAAEREPIFANVGDEAEYAYDDVRIEGTYYDWSPPQLFQTSSSHRNEPPSSDPNPPNPRGVPGRGATNASATSSSSGGSASPEPPSPAKRKVVELFRPLTHDDEDLTATLSDIATWRAQEHGDLPAEFPFDDPDDYGNLLDVVEAAGGPKKLLSNYYDWAEAQQG